MNGFGEFIPLKSLYKLYASLGEPHTLLTYLRAVRRPPHHEEYTRHTFVQTSDTVTLEGRNIFVFSDEITYTLGNCMIIKQRYFKLFYTSKIIKTTVFFIFFKRRKGVIFFN